MADVGTRVAIAFHRSMYLPDAVREAASAYGAYCTNVSIEESAAEVTVTLEGFDPGYGDVFGDEFANYALGQSIVRTREALAGGPA
ncbi:MAG TPA: HxsD-like protein [Myxococcota bacterium]|nr:HxsD-like protein [Myxococcota bacterium]